jgi:predicted amidohydrolase YtcJ
MPIGSTITSGVLPGSLLLRDAEVNGTRRADIRLRGGVVAEVAPALGRVPGEQVIDCDGGAVMPGLCDHHLHLHAMAAARASVRCGPDAAAMAAALRAAAPDDSGWIRGTGYFESVAGDLDAADLDRMRSDLPVRIQHRSGALWILNSAALAAIGLDAGAAERFRDPASPGGRPPGTPGTGAAQRFRGNATDHLGVERDAGGRPTGRLWRADEWLRQRLGERPFPGLAGVGAQIFGYGITAVTDATPDLSDAAVAHIGDAMARAELPPRVQLLGVSLGAWMPGIPGLTAGPYKIVLADSGMLTYPELAGRISVAHAAGRAVAVHCVTREALVLLLAALREAGTVPGDRIEHAGIVPGDLISDVAELGVRVVTQPGFLADRGDDFLRDLPAGDHADLYRCASLLGAGVPVALSSDAPYGPADPWAVMAAAVSRRTASGQVAGEQERIGFRGALSAYLGAPEDPGGAPRRVRAGSPADLVILRVPLAELPSAASPVRVVVSGGVMRNLDSGYPETLFSSHARGIHRGGADGAADGRPAGRRGA